MQSITRTTLLAAQLAASTLLKLGSRDALLTFGSDAKTGERISALPENPSFEQVMQALDVPSDAKDTLLDTIDSGRNINYGTLSKAVEVIELARKEREKAAQWARARGDETSYGKQDTLTSFDLTSERGIRSAIDSVLSAIMGGGRRSSNLS